MATTITDVARVAGVGVGTVSRVINNAPSVDPLTAQKIRRVIAQLGYQRAAPGHRRGPRIAKPRPEPGEGGTVLLALRESHGLKWILDYAPVYSYVLHGMESELASRNRNLLVRQAGKWDDLAGVIRNTPLQGILILGERPAGDIPEVLQRTPMVWAMGTPGHFGGDQVQADHLRVGVLAAEHLLAKGHRHCAYLGDTAATASNYASLRCLGFCSTIEEAGGKAELLVDSSLIVTSPQQNAVDEQVLSRLLDRLLGLDPRPTALMLLADVFAPSVYRQLLERKVRPERDITIVTCNNERPYLAGLRPRPIVIDLQAEAIGRRAVDQILWRTEHPNEAAVRVMVEPLLLESSPERLS